MGVTDYDGSSFYADEYMIDLWLRLMITLLCARQVWY